MCCLNMECSEVLLRSPSFLSCLHSTFHPLWVSFSPLKAFTRNNNKEQPTPLLSNPFCPRTFSLSIAIHLSVLCFSESIMLSINIKIVIYSTSVLQPIIIDDDARGVLGTCSLTEDETRVHTLSNPDSTLLAWDHFKCPLYGVVLISGGCSYWLKCKYNI